MYKEESGKMEGIAAVLTKAIAFVAIIVMGYVLKRIHVFKKDDFYLLSKVVIRITLPAAIVTNFSQISMENSLLFMCVLGIACNLVFVAAGYLINVKHTPMDKAFGMLNLAGYNIGNFTMPFVQSFLGPVGFAVTSLFDAGNSVMCTGITYTLASAAAGKSQKGSKLGMLKTLFSSVPFDTYLIMTALAILRVKLPDVVLSFAATAGGANAFLALFMIGIGFDIRLAEKDKIHKIVRMLAIRYGFALVMSVGFFFLSPFSLEIRQALAILMFGPIASVSPAFTGKLDGDIELSSAINSISIVISILSITAALILVL
ncbi:MAG: AEC family transporter [bacterium]|nr:AEC family transporter [bacterium]